MSVDNDANVITTSSSQDIKSMKLQLGDIITITSPDNEIFNNQTFIIDFINQSKIVVINTSTLEVSTLQIMSDGTLNDVTILEIDLIFRNKYPGYAKQNNLVPGKWINIYFGGNIPLTITGNITNLQEDMIEIKTYPDGETIYINFAYSGIPEDLPIELIEIRERPEKVRISPVEEEIDQASDTEQVEGEERRDDNIEDIQVSDYTDRSFTKDLTDDNDEAEEILEIPKQQVEEKIHQMLVEADDIVFGLGEEFAPVTQYIEKDLTNVRYSIEAQCNDLLDEMLSTIPDHERTRSVLTNIHTMIERFKELRTKFSILDKHGNVLAPLKRGSDWKPLTEQLVKFNHILYWLIPVAKFVKKVYDVTGELEDLPNDIVTLKTTQNLQSIQDDFEMYKSNNFPDEESKYNFLMKFLHREQTPFQGVNPEELSNVIYSSDVGTNIEAIVNNLGSLYSSVVSSNNLSARRFVIQKYNLGTKSIVSSKLNKKNMTYQLNDITPADTMSIGSIITLPAPVQLFSRINLPKTSILERSNLNASFVHYWQLLQTFTKINTISVNEKKQLFQGDKDKYLNEITQYVMEKSKETTDLYTEEELYTNFINQIVPSTEKLFEFSAHHLNGEISLDRALKYMEPFLVYGDDITDMQYLFMIEAIEKQIANRIKKYVEKSHAFFKLKSIKTNLALNPSAQSIYDAAGNLSKEIFSKGYDYTKLFTLSNSELLHRILQKDAGRLYNSSIAMESIPLMFPDSIATLFENTSTSNKELLEEYANQGECKKYVIAKQYTSLDELESDNNKDIYFDKKFDTTRYSILDENEYQKEMATRDLDEFIDFLVKKLEKKEKLNTEEAYYLAETLVNGMKKVVQGDYAFIFDINAEGTETSISYFERVGNMWKKDEQVDKSFFINDEKLLCDLQKDCISANNKCEPTNLNKAQLEEKTLKNILTEFDEKYLVSKDKMEDKIKTAFEYNNEIIEKLTSIQADMLYKYNNQRVEIGSKTHELITNIISPYYSRLQLILGQGDFTKKQNDIIRFAMQFTRKALPHLDESEGWRYCIKTAVPLLPEFRYTLASAFINTPDMYIATIESLKNTIGKISDDGNAWVDIHSGEVIVQDNFEMEDVYVNGFKEQSRGLMERDASEKVNGLLKAQQNQSHDMKICNNVVDAFSDKMGINVEDHRHFITNFTIQLFRSKIPNEKDYNIKVKEAKKNQKNLPTYSELYNTYLLYYTMATFLISIQTSVPSIVTHRTFPGCISSFKGFPFDGTGDDSGVNYVACVAYAMKNSYEPWKVLLKKKQTTISKILKDTIQQNFVQNAEIQRKFEEKAEYLLSQPLEPIPDQVNVVSTWINFLPPLVPLKLSTPHPLTTEFKSKLLQDLKSGYAGQREDLLVVESKIIFYSLALQQRIQKVVGQHTPLLKNVSNVPFVENACCDTKNNEISTIGYFVEKDKEIAVYNTMVKNLSNILEDVTVISRGGLFYSPLNTKNLYPSLSGEFNENTIYTAFVVYCRFNSILPTPEYLTKFCEEKPTNIKPNETIREIITKLKTDGRIYTNEALVQMFQEVSRENIVHTSFSMPKRDYLNRLRNILEKEEEEENSKFEYSISETFTAFMLNKLDTFDITDSDDGSSRDFKNYLAKANVSMKDTIITFMNEHITNEISSSTLKTLFDHLLEFQENNEFGSPYISDTDGYNFIGVFNTFLTNFINIYPTIILNKVDYENVVVPPYWKVSKTHASDIKSMTKKEVEELRRFYDNSVIFTLLEKIQESGKEILNLANATPYFTKISFQDKEVNSLFDQRTSILLTEHYFLLTFMKYIELTDDPNTLFVEKQTKEIFDDTFTIESLDDMESHVDISIQREDNELILEGNKNALKKTTSNLMFSYLKMITKTMDVVKTPYNVIMDRVFRLQEGEKHQFTQRLDSMTDEQRDVNVVMKINKLEEWGKGLKKGILSYDANVYDEEREAMLKIESNQRMLFSNPDVVDRNIDQYMTDLNDEQRTSEEIENDAYDMSHMTDDYQDGHYDGNEEENVHEYD